MTPEQLDALNHAVKWTSRTEIAGGGFLGDPNGRLYPIPDPRIVALASRVPLEMMDVVELGCYEGAHTVALATIAKRVVAVEGRADSIACAMVRCACYGVKPDFMLFDIEDGFPWPVVDVYVSIGVLYHMKEPLKSLYKTCDSARRAVLLDTHYTRTPNAKLDGFDVERHGEPEDRKSGLHGYSLWMTLPAIVAFLREHFDDLEILDDRLERNGPRCTIIATGKKENARAS